MRLHRTSSVFQFWLCLYVMRSLDVDSAQLHPALYTPKAAAEDLSRRTIWGWSSWRDAWFTLQSLPVDAAPCRKHTFHHSCRFLLVNQVFWRILAIASVSCINNDTLFSPAGLGSTFLAESQIALHLYSDWMKAGELMGQLAPTWLNSHSWLWL